MKPARINPLIIAAFAASATANIVHAVVPVRTVALSGQPAPGTIAGADFASFRFPSMDASGRVAFAATLAGPSVGTTNDSGIWSEGTGSLTLVAREGSAAPGTDAGVNFGDFLFGAPVINDSGRTAFGARLSGVGVTAGNEFGIWSEGSGALTLVVRRGNPAPVTPPGATFDAFAGPLFNAAGQTAFRGDLTGTGVTGFNDRSMWLEDHGALMPVAREGDAAPGTEAGTNLGSLYETVLNSAGQLAFLSDLIISGVPRLSAAVWSGGPGALKVVARRGNAAPGTDVNFISFGFPAITNAGRTAFYARLATASGDDGIWSEGPGVLTLVARTGIEAPGAGAGINFGLTFPGFSFGDPVLNGAGHTAFTAGLSGAGVDPTNDTGLWSEGSGALKLVAREGSPAPGTPAGVNFGDMEPFQNGLEFVLNGAGQTVFAVMLTGPAVTAGVNDRALLAEVGPGGALALIARTGDTMEVAPGDLRTLSSLGYRDFSGLEDGRGPGFNDAGQVAFSATFTDGSSGVFVSIGPDAEGDGVNDAFDNCPDTPNADQADADGDRIGDACETAAPNPDGAAGCGACGPGMATVMATAVSMLVMRGRSRRRVGRPCLQLAIAVLGTLVAAAEVRAQFPGTISPPAPLNANATTDTARDVQPRMATDGQGRWVAVWHIREPPSGESEIFVARSTDNGATWTAPAVLNNNAGSDSRDDLKALIATDGQGHWVVVWYSNEDLAGTGGQDFDIRVSRSEDNGETWTDVASLNTTAATDTRNDTEPQIITDGLGHWLAVWHSNDPQNGSLGRDVEIFVARSMDNGATWTAPQPVNTNAATDVGDDVDPRIATDGRGHWVAVWASNENLGGVVDTEGDLLVARSADNGATWTSPEALNNNAAGDAGIDERPRLAADAQGAWVVVWESYEDLGEDNETDRDILVARSADNGLTWTPPAVLNTNATNDADDDKIAEITTDGQGNWVTVWEREKDLGGNQGSEGDILVALSSDNGVTWTDPAPFNINANSDSGFDEDIELKTDGRGNWVGAWGSNENLDGVTSVDGDILTAHFALPDCNTNGVGDGQDLADSASADCDGNGVPDECQTDSDGDGLPDVCDGCPSDPSKTSAGVCGCGVTDADSDGDGTADCDDDCPADSTKTEIGACGCGVPDSDANGNGIADCQESPVPQAAAGCGTCGSGAPAMMPFAVSSILISRRRRIQRRK
jgi:hypothetical protein